MRASFIVLGFLYVFCFGALGHEVEICSQLTGEHGRGNALFRENHGEAMRLIVEVEGLKPNSSFDIVYTGVVIGALDTNDQGIGVVVFRQHPDEGELPLPPEVEMLLTGDELRVGPLLGRMGQIGDLNSDCEIDAFDIEPFLLALFDRDALHMRFPRISPDYSADANHDGVANAFDIEPFLELLFR